MRTPPKLAAAAAFTAALMGCSDTLSPPPEKPPTSTAPAFASAANVAVSNITARSGKTYKAVTGGLLLGVTQYVDRIATFRSALPSALNKQTYIRTANGDHNAFAGSASFLSFDVGTDVVVYVAHDDRVTRPSWLKQSFTDTGWELTSAGNTKFSLFKRSFPKGRVTLGSNSEKATDYKMYSVVVVPASSAPSPPDDSTGNSPGGGGGSHEGFYVTTTGSSSGDGSAGRPWSLTAALAQPSAVQPGDTIWLRGGTYKGCYTSKLSGTSSAPIVVRQYPGERAVLDNGSCNDPAITAYGAYTWFWGLEVQNSSPRAGGQLGINGFGREVKFINLVIHDASASGLGFWSQAVGGEVYGCIIYNNGRSRNLDHGIYSQNASGTKVLKDNVIFNQYAYGIHVYGSDNATLRGYEITGNTVFNNGTIDHGGSTPNILVGGGAPASGITVSDNVAYQSQNESGNVWLGYDAQNQDLVARNNYIAGGFTALRIWRWNSGEVRDNSVYTADYYPLDTEGSVGGLSWSANTWYRPPTMRAWTHANVARTWTDWKSATGKGGSDVTGNAAPTGVRTFVRPNRYEAGRGHVTILNWDRQGSVAVDVSSILRPGDRYQVHNVLQVNGSPVLSGTYGGGTLSFPMGQVSAPAPIGGGATTGASTGQEFQVFLVTKS